MAVYEWNTFCPTLFGKGASKETGKRVKAMGAHNVMVCTEAALMEFGVATQVVDVLKDEGLDVFIFDKCTADAPSTTCDEGAAFVREHDIDAIVAVGGGSSLDTAKAIGIIISQHGTTIRDYYNMEEDAHEIILITLSTTSGTGSENSKWCVIGDVETGRKRMPVYKPDLAIVDPVLTYTVPAGPTAATGMDVLAHAVEGLTNRNYNPYGYIFAKEAIRLVMKYLPIAVAEPKNEEARAQMAFASNIAGLAMTALGCSIGHSFAQTFGAMKHVAHGLGCAWGLPGVMVYSAKYGEADNIKAVADAMDIAYDENTDVAALAEQIAGVFIQMMKDLGIKSIKDSGYSLEDCMESAEMFFDDGAFGNSPGEPGMKEIKEYIEYTYQAY